MIAALEQALTEEFDGEVIFVPWLPPTILPPAVVVAPGKPYSVPGTHGGVTVRYQIMVAVSVKEPRLVPEQILQLGMRVRRVAQSVGAVWHETDGPEQGGTPNLQTAISINEITIRHQPEE